MAEPAEIVEKEMALTEEKPDIVTNPAPGEPEIVKPAAAEEAPVPVETNTVAEVVASEHVAPSGPTEVDDTGSEGEEEEEGEGEEEGQDGPKQLDDDLDRRNPQYIPKGGAFYEHDNRTSDVTEPEDPAEAEKKKKIWKDSKTKERWLHDCYVEDQQGPKSTQELIDVYGYDIRNEESAPRARRRRRYGRGPDKYERKWDDEEAYSQKGIRGRPPRKHEEDFPPLPNQKNGHIDRREGKPAPAGSWREQRQSEPRGPPRNAPPPRSNAPQQQEQAKPKPRLEDSIKPFRNDGGARKPIDARDLPRGRISEGRQSYTERDLQELTRDVSNMNVQQKPKPKVGNDAKTNSPPDPRDQGRNQANSRQNPKRYSKISKGFYFPPETIPPPLDLREISKMQVTASMTGQGRTVQHVPSQTQQQQPPSQPRPDNVMVQNVMQRYPDSYNGNPQFIPTRTILQPMAQPGLSTPASLPPGTLSPQMGGLEMSPQPGFVPPLYIDMRQGEVVPFQGYPYPQGQNTEIFQPPAQAMPSGITYYSPEIQGSGIQQRALPLRRKAAIPILPPPDSR